MFRKKILPDNGVIVLGGHVQGLSIARIMGRENVKSFIIENTSLNLARFSKYSIGFKCIQEDYLLDYLVKCGKEGIFPGKWIIFPTSDGHVQLLSKNKEVLEKYYHVATNNWDVIKYCYNKIETYKIASSIDIPIPWSLFPKDLAELESLDVSYPCIIKPSIMHLFYKQTKKKAYKCHNKQELISNYKLALQYIDKEQIIIQEFIHGSNDNLYSACLLQIENNPVVKLVASRNRQHPMEFGNATTYAETTQKDILIEHAVKFLKKINYQGICEIEFKYDSNNNKYKLLEINPRTWKWHAIAIASESPFLPTYYNYLNKGKITEYHTWKNAAFWHLLVDLPILLKLFFTGKLKSKSKSSKIIYAVWNKKDIKPAIMQIILLPYFILKR